MTWGRDTTDKLFKNVNSKMSILCQHRTELDRLQMRNGEQSILIRMTSASRQLKVVSDMLVAFRAFFRDATEAGRTTLLDELSSLEKRYATAFDTIEVSTQVLLEAAS